MTTWGHSGSSQWKGKAQSIVSGCSVGREQAVPEAPKSKKGFQKKKCWFRILGTDLAPQNGGQRNETNGWVSLRCPPVSGTKSVPKTGTIFWKKKPFFLHVFFVKKVFFSKRTVVYAMILPFLFWLRVRRNKRKRSAQRNGGGLYCFMFHL